MISEWRSMLTLMNIVLAKQKTKTKRIKNTYHGHIVSEHVFVRYGANPSRFVPVATVTLRRDESVQRIQCWHEVILQKCKQFVITEKLNKWILTEWTTSVDHVFLLVIMEKPPLFGSIWNSPTPLLTWTNIVLASKIMSHLTERSNHMVYPPPTTHIQS